MNPLSHFYTLRSYVESYAGLLGPRFLSVIWLAAVCVVIWFYGYLLGWGDFRPLESARARLIVIGILVLAWVVYIVISVIRARRRDKALVDAIENDAAADAAASQQAEVGEIHNRLKEALGLLRRVTRKRFGYVYELPWYVIFGAPGSGKTTALMNSGLKFPLGDALGSNSVQGIGGTRNCNWWFTDDAILIDTAGRYTTQDDLNGASKAGWEGFLGLLRKYRRSQPINGVLVTVSIGDLLSRDADGRLEEMRAIRQRLSELDEYLAARIPVYLVLTKADLLTGFVEFFDGFNKSDREQVWGMTFGLDESYEARNLPERFGEEFALLQERVGAMLIERLQQEPDREARGRIFRFPAALSSLKDRLQELVDELCSGSKLVEPPLLRGVYFASGTQAEEAAPAGQPVPRTRRSYFLSRLFSDVIFDEASLVARDKRLSQRQLILRRTVYAAAAVLLAMVLVSWTATFWHNRQALARADERLDAYEQAVRGIPVQDVSDADFLRILPALDHLRDVTADFSAPTWRVSFGLDQGEKIASRQREAYRRALNSLLLPRMMVHLQQELDTAENTGETFDALKLYGMLGGLGPVDPEFVSVRSQDIFGELYPGQGRSTARQSLVQHMEALARGVLPQLALDEPLIAEAREAIRSQSIATRAYDILKDSAPARSVQPWVPADAFGSLGEQAFERASGVSLREGVHGIYTADGYRTAVLPRVDAAAREALDESWVRGQANPGGLTIEMVAEATHELYRDNLTREWTAIVSDLRVRQSQNLTEAADTARVLAANPGPLEAAAAALVKVTDFQLGDAAAATTSLVGEPDFPDPFEALREMLRTQAEAGNADNGEAPPSQMAALHPLLESIYSQLSRAATSSAEVAQIFDVGGQLTTANQDLLQEARRLPNPLDTWLAGYAADIGSLAVKTAQSRLGEAWSSEGTICPAIVTGRYPFDRTSSRDVAMSDFVRLFGPSGLFNTFFTERLEAFVDTSVSPWTWRGTFGAPGVPSEALAQFENASTIRRAFFPAESETPRIAITVTPTDLSGIASAVRLDIEGERVIYNGVRAQAKSVTWPSTTTSKVSEIVFLPGGWGESLSETGDWSAFRLFDRAEITEETADLFNARFRNGDHVADFEVQFNSVINPFSLPALSAFVCPTQF